MCFSAIVEQDLARLKRDFQAKPDLRAFKKLFERRSQGAPLLIPKAMEANFRTPAATSEEAEIAGLIADYKRQKSLELETALEKQRARLTEADRGLAMKATKKLENERRIATNKIAMYEGHLKNLARREIERRDSRIFPQHYAPVVVVENGERIIKPMRYLLRRAGRPASDDRTLEGCYNARRDNLSRFWRGQFGHSHGVMVVASFYENVSRHAMEHRELRPGEKEENVVLQFDPRPETRMLVACLWSHWTGNGEPDLLSFAAVTDEPPVEIAAAGHDRCIVPINELNNETWLKPLGRSDADLFRILDERERPFYEHKIAA